MRRGSVSSAISAPTIDSMYTPIARIHPASMNRYATPHCVMTPHTRSGRRFSTVPLVVDVSRIAGNASVPTIESVTSSDSRICSGTSSNMQHRPGP